MGTFASLFPSKMVAKLGVRLFGNCDILQHHKLLVVED